MTKAACLSDAWAAWCQSGVVLLSGDAHGPPILPASGTLNAIFKLEGEIKEAFGHTVSPLEMLADRAALMGLHRGGAWSCGRACRIVQAQDGWVAVNLPRPEDFDLIPAWLGTRPNWRSIVAAIGRRGAATLLADARELGLAVSGLKEAGADAECPAERGIGRRVLGVPSGGRDLSRDPPLVIDLSALWAGPLCGSLLVQAGAHVIKVEAASRIDPIRESCPAHFDLLNGGKTSVVLDFQCAEGRARLLTLVSRADAIITSARPRALVQLGLSPDVLFAGNPSLTWVAITGHGWFGAQSNRIGFGDDAAFAGGLVIELPDGKPGFFGDAIADPLSGLTAALAALDALGAGGGVLLDVGLARVSQYLAREDDPTPEYAIGKSGRHWAATNGTSTQRLSRPVARHAPMAARPFGADTASVLATLA